jgi:hypothetical protein
MLPWINTREIICNNLMLYLLPKEGKTLNTFSISPVKVCISVRHSLNIIGFLRDWHYLLYYQNPYANLTDVM